MPVLDLIDNNYLNTFSVPSIHSVSSNTITDSNSDSLSIDSDSLSIDSDSFSNDKILFFDNNLHLIKIKNNNLKAKKNIRNLFKI